MIRARAQFFIRRRARSGSNYSCSCRRRHHRHCRCRRRRRRCRSRRSQPRHWLLAYRRARIAGGERTTDERWARRRLAATALSGGTNWQRQRSRCRSCVCVRARLRARGKSRDTTLVRRFSFARVRARASKVAAAFAERHTGKSVRTCARGKANERAPHRRRIAAVAAIAAAADGVLI